MQHLLEQPHRDVMPCYAVFRGRLSPSECERVLTLAKLQPQAGGTIGGGKLSPAVRTSQVAWLRRTHDTDWLYARLAAVAQEARDAYYPFHLSGFWEPLQVSRYIGSDRGHYSEHKDLGPGATSVRKLSLVCLLSPRSEFGGGTLRMLGKSHSDKACHELSQGTVIAFPAWELHAVSPVTRGERASLVAWVCGPPFA